MQRRFALAALSLALSTPALAASPGTSVFGYAWGDFVIGCTTCPHIPLTMSGNPEQLAADPVSSAVAYTGLGLDSPELADYTLAGGASYAGYARFDGPLATPWMGARASTDNEQAFIVLEPAVPVGIDLYSASVDARTVMRYQYSGSTVASYTFHFGVDGMVSNDQSSVFASASIYANDDTGFETGLIDFGFAMFQGSGISSPLTPFAGSFSVSVDVAPGDSFWLLGTLAVAANHTYSSADVAVDAHDTLRVTSIDGDTQWLQASAVPEPSAAVLLTLGLAALAWRRRPR